MMAAACGREPVVAALVAASADVDAAVEGSGSTALWLSSCLGHTGVVRALLAGSAAVDLPIKSGVTPLQIAVIREHPEVVALLRAAASQPH